MITFIGIAILGMFHIKMNELSLSVEIICNRRRFKVKCTVLFAPPRLLLLPISYRTQDMAAEGSSAHAPCAEQAVTLPLGNEFAHMSCMERNRVNAGALTRLTVGTSLYNGLFFVIFTPDSNGNLHSWLILWMSN